MTNLDASGSGSLNDALRGFLIRITAGTGNGQSREIINNDETTKVVEVTPDWNTAPDTAPPAAPANLQVTPP